MSRFSEDKEGASIAIVLVFYLQITVKQCPIFAKEECELPVTLSLHLQWNQLSVKMRGLWADSCSSLSSLEEDTCSGKPTGKMSCKLEFSLPSTEYIEVVGLLGKHSEHCTLLDDWDLHYPNISNHHFQFGQLGVGDNIDHSSPQRVKLAAEEKVVQVSCGWRHTVAITDNSNVFSWGRGTSGQLGHGDIVDRNMPELIEALSMDGSACQQIQTSKTTVLSGSSWISPSERYAVVPDETGTGKLSAALESSVTDASVPDGDVKRVRTG